MVCRVNPSRREAVPTSYGVSLPPGVCRNLKSIVVQVGIVDYFKEPHSPEAKKMFEEMVNKLQVRVTQWRTFWLSGGHPEDLLWFGPKSQRLKQDLACCSSFPLP